jgi:serine/threonine protein kinase/Flp pilus assembly protein TadD
MAKVESKRACSVCGTLLADDSAYCPVCALRGVLETQSDSVTDPSSELRFEHYEVLRNQDGKPLELGHGGMGVTYKAIDTHLRCSVALKIIRAQFIGNESARSRFVREARAAASVHHSNVATVYHLGESGGNYFYAMEFVDGETLEKLIRRRGRLEVDLSLEMLTQVAAGLTAIHKQHLVHRDIKPSNIMLSWEEGRLEKVKIIDLGLAKGVTEDALSMAGSFIGTPTYASPEQFAGLGTDIRSDLYSLGVSLWEMLSGRPPFQGSAAELMDQHQHSEPPIEILRNVPGPVIALLQVLLAKDPNQRFQTPAQLQRAVTKVKAAVSSGSRLRADELRSVSAELAPNVSKRKPRNRTVRWVLGASLGVASALIAWFFFSPYRGALFKQRSDEAVPTEKSIAVLPFENISPNKDDAYFADGVQDEILNNLVKIAQLKVISRTSVMQYRADTKRDLRQIANALGVANVLEGTVRRDGNHIRVSTELVDASNDHTMWADTYDRDLTDIFAIQSEIAQTVAAKLSARLTPEEKRDVEGKPTDNLGAYDLYLQANQLLKNAEFFNAQREDFIKALALLEEATRQDPRFALAYCSIAHAHDALYLFHLDRTAERRALGDAAVNEALRMRPDLPEAHLASALHLGICYRDFEKERVEIAIAARGLPNHPYVFWFLAATGFAQGRWEESIRDYEHAVILEPRYPKLLLELANTYTALRRFRQADQMLDRLIELKPDEPELKIQKAYLLIMEKADLKRYLTVFETIPATFKDRKGVVWRLLQAALFEHDWSKAREILNHTANEEIDSPFYDDAEISRDCWNIWVLRLQGNSPTKEPRFGVARDQLNRKVEQNPEDVDLLSALGVIDAALGRKQEAIDEARRAAELVPVLRDHEKGPIYVTNLAIVYAWLNELDSAFQELTVVVNIPNGPLYGELKLDPAWDPLRKDPRFDKLLAELAPRD